MMEAVYRVWLWVAILFTALTYASPMETAGEFLSVESEIMSGGSLTEP